MNTIEIYMVKKDESMCQDMRLINNQIALKTKQIEFTTLVQVSKKNV